jgi:hypothetical protein
MALLAWLEQKGRLLSARSEPADPRSKRAWGLHRLLMSLASGS